MYSKVAQKLSGVVIKQWFVIPFLDSVIFSSPSRHLSVPSSFLFSMPQNFQDYFFFESVMWRTFIIFVKCGLSFTRCQLFSTTLTYYHPSISFYSTKSPGVLCFLVPAAMGSALHNLRWVWITFCSLSTFQYHSNLLSSLSISLYSTKPQGV